VGLSFLVLPISKTLDSNSKTPYYFFSNSRTFKPSSKIGLDFIYTVDTLLYYTLYVHKVQKLIKINI
jgi:hypothetical protein